MLSKPDFAELLEIQAERRRLDEREMEIWSRYQEDEGQIDFSMFKDTTRRLLVELWDAPGKMLSQEHIKEYVIFDEDASDRAVRLVIDRARKEMKCCPDFHYEINNVRGKGYQLISREVFQSVSQPSKKPGKTAKKHETL